MYAPIEKVIRYQLTGTALRADNVEDNDSPRQSPVQDDGFRAEDSPRPSSPNSNSPSRSPLAALSLLKMDPANQSNNTALEIISIRTDCLPGRVEPKIIGLRSVMERSQLEDVDNGF
jgi:hypothetical protein